MPRLLNNRDEYRQVKKLQNSGHSLIQIATLLYISKTCVKEILSVSRLSPRLKRAYLEGLLSRSQAKALVTLADHDMQEALLVKLGPFAQETDILCAIEEGKSIISPKITPLSGPENIVNLPKPAPVKTLPKAA